jgi:hypothetical protein
VPFTAETKPYKSTRPLIFNVVDFFPTGAGNATMAHAVAPAGQILNFFAYGQGDQIPDGFGNQFPATDDDTNQQTAFQTEGAEEFVIEGMSLSGRSVRAKYNITPPIIGGPTDPAVLAAYYGPTVPGAYNQQAVPFMDPGALAIPPQAMSPFNLEQALLSAAQPHLSVVFQWDRRNTQFIGTADELPEGGGKSYLRANGQPSTNNRYKVPEGYLWRRKGQPDSNFQCIMVLQRPVVVPITLIGTFGSDTVDDTLSKLALDITVRAHGLSVEPLSNN